MHLFIDATPITGFHLSCRSVGGMPSLQILILYCISCNLLFVYHILLSNLLNNQYILFSFSALVKVITNVSGAIDNKDRQMALRSSKSKITVCAKVKMQRQFRLPHQKMKAKLTDPPFGNLTNRYVH